MIAASKVAVKLMRRCPQPIIALVNGAASGGGMALALASDVRIATPTARMNAATAGKTGADYIAAQKAETKKDFPEAVYNAGLAYQRCAKDADAKAQFSAALAADAKQHRARAALAMYDYREKGDAALESTMQSLQQLHRACACILRMQIRRAR